MRHTVRSLMLGVLAATLMAAAPIEAQRGAEGRRGGMQNRQQLEQRIRAQMGRMMEERLGLSEEEATQLSEVVRGFQQQRRDLSRQERATRLRVEAFLEEGGTDEVEAAELLTRMSELRVEEAALFAAEQTALLDVISATQLLQMQAFREQIGQRIRALRGRRGGEATGRRRGGQR